MTDSRNPQDATEPGSRFAPSLRARLAGFALRCFVKPVFGPRVPLKWQRRYLELMRFTLVSPLGVRRESVDLGGIISDRLELASGAAKGAILYLHGGGYAIGSPATHRALASHICKATRRTVYVPRYRLAPEHPYPAQLKDACTALDALQIKGVSSAGLVLIGDSAGGNLALSLLLNLKRTGQPLPAALVLISPWVDPVAAIADNGQDALVSAGWAEQLRKAFLPAPLHRDYTSIFEADLYGLPPVLIQCASAELLQPQADRLATRLRAYGLTVTLDQEPGMWHDYQLHAGLVPEATSAVKRIAAFVAKLPH